MSKLKVIKIKSHSDIKLSVYAEFLANEDSFWGTAKDAKDKKESALLNHMIKAMLILNPHTTEKELRQVPFTEVEKYYTDVVTMFNTSGSSNFKRIIQIGNQKYGFEPNLYAMETGAFTDVAELSESLSKGNLLLIIAILYRPVTEVLSKKLYSITKYETEDSTNIEQRANLFGDYLDGSIIRDALTHFAKARS